MHTRFKFPPRFDDSDLWSGIGNKVCVVSVIGKSRHSSHHSKACRLNKIIGVEVFGGMTHNTNMEDKDCVIYGHYNPELQVLFLELHSQYDTNMLVKSCLQQSPDVAKYIRTLLMLFSLSHIILLVSPGTSLDISWLRLFEVLQTARHKLQPSLSDLLHSHSLPQAWANAARPCCPRVLFLFEKCPSPVSQAGNAAIKRLQHAIEDQIYRLLRRARIITNISNNSLFAVPANQEYVYIATRTTDTLGFFLSLIKEHCDAARETDPLRQSYLTPTPPVDLQDTIFSTFLMSHINLAHGKGFDDNLGRNPVPAVFQLPTAETCFKVCSTLYDFFLADNPDTTAHFSTCVAMLNVNTRFSESRCAKVLPLAENTYQEGLPQLYTKDIHETHLCRAQQVFASVARGPARDHYSAMLESNCHKIWCNGRQRCEKRSSTGNQCINPLHLCPQDRATERTKKLPVLAHSSQIKSKAACNCGRKQSEREDPFTHKATNYDFYRKLASICCDTLDQYEFPVATLEPDIDESQENESQTADTNIAELTQNLGQLSTTARTSDDNKHNADDEDSDKNRLRSIDDEEQQEINTDVEHDDELAEGTQESRSREKVNGRNDDDDDIIGDCDNDLDNNDCNVDVDDDDNDDDDDVINEKLDEDDDDDEEDDEDDDDDNDSSDDGSNGSSITNKRDNLRDDNLSDNDTKVEDDVKRSAQFYTEEEVVVLQSESVGRMIHSQSELGFLPDYPAWSLLCLGKYSAYSPLQGVEQPGFSLGYNFLLPWDIKVKHDKWPSIGENAKKTKTKKPLIDTPESVLRLYVGFEYECPRGHRFFSSAPEKVFKAPASGIFKETAEKVMRSDMPLFCSCTCRSTKGQLAQLQRFHIAVPTTPASIQVLLNPRVQPIAPPCPFFYPGNDSPIPLPGNSMWVLRLPYVYEPEDGPYPAEQRLAGRLLSSLCTVSESKTATMS